MTPPRRRSRHALATPVLLTALALAPLSSALLPTTATATDTPTSPIQVRLTTLRPIAPQPGNTLVLTGSIRNVSDTDVASLGYQLKLSGAIGSRDAFDGYAADPAGDLDGLFAADSVVDASEPTLAPGASEPFRLTLDLDPATLNLLNLPQTWQVHELGIAVTGTPTGSPETGPVGQLRTFLPWAPRTAIGVGLPTRVAWIWPLVDRPHRTTTSTWFDDGLAPEISGQGRLAGLADAGAAAEGQRPRGRHPTTHNVPVTWAIDPMLVNDVEAMGAGYRVTTSTGTSSGTGTRAAKTWLGTLQGAVTKTDAAVLPLPYADPDIVAGVRAGFRIAIGVATLSGRVMLQQALGAVTLLRYGWPPGGLSDQQGVNELSATGDGTVVLSDAAVPVIGGQPPVTPSAHTLITTSDGTVDTILTESGLSTDVDSGVDDPNGSALSLQRFLAETLMIQAESPSRQRDVVVAPDRRWDPTPAYANAVLADTGKVPWIQPVSLQTVDNSPLYRNVQREPLTYPSSARHDELSPSYLHRVSTLRNEIGDFSAILPSGDAQIRSYTTAEQQALSSAWREQPDLAGDELRALNANVLGQMSQVRIASHKNSFVTLTGHGGKVPVTISNNLATPVLVTVQLEPNQRLSFTRHGRVTVPVIPPHQKTVVDVHAAAKTSGVFPLQVQLLTPKGQPYGPSVRLFVRSTAYGTITLVITGAATAALMVAVAIRLTRRALVARRSTASASAST
jgi:hypothetical protein